MIHVDVLRGQATVLWRLAKSFDVPLRPARTCHSVRGLAEDPMRKEAEQRESENALP